MADGWAVAIASLITYFPWHHREKYEDDKVIMIAN